MNGFIDVEFDVDECLANAVVVGRDATQKPGQHGPVSGRYSEEERVAFLDFRPEVDAKLFDPALDGQGPESAERPVPAGIVVSTDE